MKCSYSKALFCLLLSGVVFSCFAQKKVMAEQWLTRGDSTVLFRQQPSLTFGNTSTTSNNINLDENKTYQQIEGFGFALTQGSAMHLAKMSAAARAAILRELFDTTGNNIGISYMRLSIGASDLNEKIYSYNDLEPGQTDTALARFDLGADRQDVIPVMKEILQINPAIKILGSPWSPPAWMKTNNDTRGGRLQEIYFPVYARYLLRYIQEMKKEGITIDAITIQNEPLHPGNNPSLLMTAPEQTEFIKRHLGPLFKEQDIDTRIIVYDHNADRPDYPIYILNDPEARKYVDGSGFHLYAGEIGALTEVHDAHPDKHIYFTEQMVVQFKEWQQPDDPRLNIARTVTDLFIGATRNWSRNVLEWNLTSNSQLTPYTDRGGCNICQGALTIDGDTVSRNLAYYAMAHASKFVRPGSVRIASAGATNVSHVAFKTPGNRIVLIVSNTSNQKQTFTIRQKGRSLTTSLDAGSVATYHWK